jgi:dTDP-glucose 4,6-dehydratase
VKILVTGVAGFIGSHFAKHLLNEAEGDYQIIGLDSLTYSGNLANIAELTTNDSFNFIKGDINDYELVLKLLWGGLMQS